MINPICKVAGIEKNRPTINCRYQENGRTAVLAAKELVTYGLAINKNEGNLNGIPDTNEIDACVPEGGGIRCTRIRLGKKDCVGSSNVGSKLTVQMFPYVPVAPPDTAARALSALKSGKKCNMT